VFVRNDSHFGVFVFSRSVLISQGIISTEKKEGKRAFRVYPPWDIPTSQQAAKSQKWQLEYFLEIGSGNMDKDRVNELLKVGTT